MSTGAIRYGAGILKEPIEKALVRNAFDVTEVKNSVLNRQEIDGRFAIVNRDMDRIMGNLVRVVDSGATKAEMEQRFATTGKQRDEAFKNIETRLERQDRDQAEISKGVVSRREHEQRWRVLEQRDGDLQRQVDGVQRAFGDTFSLWAAVAQMRRRIGSLEGRQRSPMPAAPLPIPTRATAA